MADETSDITKEEVEEITETEATEESEEKVEEEEPPPPQPPLPLPPLLTSDRLVTVVLLFIVCAHVAYLLSALKIAKFWTLALTLWTIATTTYMLLAVQKVVPTTLLYKEQDLV